jgi:hypothetical protein
MYIYHALLSSFIFFIKPLKMDLTEGSETSAKLNLTPGENPKENTHKKNQLDATKYAGFCASTCFGHQYTHHQEYN